MLSLNSRKWNKFKIKDLFYKFQKGTCANASILKKGDIPYVGATNRNNGVLKFCDAKPEDISNGNCIIFIGQGDGSAGYSIYKKEKCLCGGTVICAYSKYLNKYVGNFISCCSDMNQSKYSHGHSRNDKRLKNDYIMLPVNNLGEPDYKFMEDYMKEREEKIKQKYKEYITTTINKSYKTVSLSKEWKEFYISDIFDIKPGKRLTKANMQTGRIPFIGATDSNNGITNFVSNENSSTDKEVLGVNYNGSVVETFYHPYKCTFSDDVKRFSTKEVKGNKYIYLFLKNVILKQKCKYMYGYKFNENRMIKQKIMLPIDSKGKPDYKYMEDYMKYLEQKKLLEYLEYKK